jgi:hypothetical protein
VPRPDDWSNLEPGTGWVLYVSQVKQAPFGIGEATQTAVMLELGSAPVLGARVDVSTAGVRARCERGNLAAHALGARGSFVLSAKTATGYRADVDLACVDSSGGEVWAVRRSLALSPIPVAAVTSRPDAR